ncbi:AbrB/MazE/SpoVT family DNA-binding domain-containing protein [Ureibacillus sp. MALMAid1270]|uniref:AbrB/MazE/SpoVT family DNA-binding domain-containing protein n=1 Tax=Ureibacillus sp. MALMAid1270 TaxID=3411629 RepID=UPI003BA6AF75
MKSTGIVRKLDVLGRIVIPSELRHHIGIEEKEPLEIFLEDDMIILQKYQPPMTCLVTGEVSSDNFRLLNGKLVLSKKGAHVLYEKIGELIK